MVAGTGSSLRIAIRTSRAERSNVGRTFHRSSPRWSVYEERRERKGKVEVEPVLEIPIIVQGFENFVIFSSASCGCL